MNTLSFVLFRGVEHKLKIIDYPGKHTQVIFREDDFIVYTNNKLEGNARAFEASKALELWLRNTAQETIRERAKKYSGIIGVSYNNLRIKDTKSRWGSCSSKGNLNFSWRIIMAPIAVMDYVIVHELCHLKHLNHSKEYWDTVEQYMPDYKEHKTWLRINGAKLSIL